MALFETKNLTFSYPLSDKTALKNVDLKVEQGEFILVMGKSGSGKSTLLRLLKKEIAPVGKIGGEINIATVSVLSVKIRKRHLFAITFARSLPLRLKMKNIQMTK